MSATSCLEIDVVVSEAGVVAGEAAADELRVMTSVVGDADDVEGVEESLSEIVDGGEKAKKMVDSYVDDMADVDVGDVMSEIDAAVSDAAVTAGEAVTAEMREMNTAFNGQSLWRRTRMFSIRLRSLEKPHGVS